MTTTSFRLTRDLAIALDHLAAERGTTRSELIREAVQQFVAAAQAGGPADRVALVRRLVDYEGSGRGDLAARSEDYLREMFGARRRDRAG
jgi:metal-responsive CopG/Arc/MetJ family transcriptional regulator